MNDTQYQRTLREVSQLSHNQSYLYTSFYNSQFRTSTYKNTPDEISQWATQQQPSPTKPTPKHTVTHDKTFLPLLSHKSIIERYKEQLKQAEVSKLLQKRSASMDVIPEKSSKSEKSTQKQRVRMSTVMLGLVLPKMKGRKVEGTVQKASKIQPSVSYVENFMKRMQHIKPHRRQHSEVVTPKTDKQEKNSPQLLNDQIQLILGESKQVAVKNSAGKLSSLKYTFRTRHKRAVVEETPNELFLQCHNPSRII